jgi:protein gp37
MTWNPVTGCTKVSQGCKHCYAERMAHRLQAMGLERYRNGFEVTLHEKLLEEPLKWPKPRTVFVNSMSDPFHEAVPLEFIQRVFSTMVRCPEHVFQVLTKRSERLKQVASELPWPDNVWMGVSVEDEQALARVTDLVCVPARVRFLSCEPLLGPLGNLTLERVHWVIVGGESRPGARAMKKDWAESILRQCRRVGIPFFLSSGVGPERSGQDGS